MEYSPREFMKSRRPEKFSDSVVVTQAKLNRLMLEYHLETLTNRNQERLFETFAVKLAQFEVCPNLRVQTGPVGGGDSKSDSETFPISDGTKLNNYEGLPNETGDKWAIAISAKKDWVAKVKSDAASIDSTKRGYKKIYFITSQFAKDKKRAEMEDTLSALYGVDVIVLDRNWILDRVFKNKREKLAIDELQLGEGLEEEISYGLLDLERLRKFNDINTAIDLAISQKDIGHRVITNALTAAILARG